MVIEDGIRLLKRLAVFLPALGVFYLAAHDVFGFFDQRLPRILALVATYLLVAYVLIPAVLRLVRFLSPPRHVPYYSTTPDGFASDPVNIALFGSRESVSQAMTSIGWYPADRRTIKTIWRLVKSIALEEPYPTAPFSSLYLLGRSQDLGFQLPVAGSPNHRHHVRFWAVKPTTAERFKEHVTFWQGHYQDDESSDDKHLWLGAASRDIGLGVIRHNAQLTHMVHHDTNAERELLVKSLRRIRAVKKSKTVTIAQPYQLRNRVLTGYMQSDGKLTILELN